MRNKDKLKFKKEFQLILLIISLFWIQFTWELFKIKNHPKFCKIYIQSIIISFGVTNFNFSCHCYHYFCIVNKDFGFPVLKNKINHSEFVWINLIINQKAWIYILFIFKHRFPTTGFRSKYINQFSHIYLLRYFLKFSKQWLLLQLMFTHFIISG